MSNEALQSEPVTSAGFWPKLFISLGNFHRRLLGVLFALVGPTISYSITRRLANLLYTLLDPMRVRCEKQCAAALTSGLSEANIAEIARESFIQRSLNLTDLMLADWRIGPTSYIKYGGRLPDDLRNRLLNAQDKHRPVILLTAYYGPFDLLPVFLGYNGVKAGVVYRKHGNASFDHYRSRIRAKSGCEMIPLDRGTIRLATILEGGGIVAIVADHPAQKRGIPVRFLGIETTAIKSIGVLACRYNADVVVAGIKRGRKAFHIEYVNLDVIKPRDWENKEDSITYITQRYLLALERMILTEPRQYLWGYARWGEKFARRITSAGELNCESALTSLSGISNGQSKVNS